MDIEKIAQATHEINRLYCQFLGDDSQVPWSQAPQWQRESAIAGVKAVIDGTAKTPQEQHEAWVKQKRDDGWAYGQIKDADKKTHPCLVSYDELPIAQQRKDSIFMAVVEGLTG